MERPPLLIELVPDTAWWSNVRSNISKKNWQKCKDFVRARSGGKCEICGGTGPNGRIDCHEIWDYNDALLVQTLVDLIALCPNCHRVKHFGRTSEVGGVMAVDRMIQHMCRVNGWTPEECETHIVSAFGVHDIRSMFQWELNIDFLKMLGIGVPEVLDREGGAHDEHREVDGEEHQAGARAPRLP